MSSWLRSFPILRRQPRSLSSVSGHPARWSCVRGWFMRSFWACNHGSAAIAPLSPHGDGRGSLCHYPRWLLCHAASFFSWIAGKCYSCAGSYLIASTRSIAYFTGESNWIRYFRALAARWLAPRHGPWLATTPCPGSFLPGSARGADEVVDGPFLQPEAARLPPPSSLPSMAGRLGGTLTFPRWRVRLQCTCACKTPPLGGIVLGSRPKPVNWRPLSRPKLTVLRAKPPLRCMPWLSCEYTKPRH